MAVQRLSGWEVRAVRGALRSLPRTWRLPARYRLDALRGRLEPEMRRLADLVEPGCVAIDVGANHGLYTYLLARRCAAVYAFEPQPECADTLEAWAHPRVTLFRAGVSDEPGELTLKVPLADGVPVTQCATFGELEGPREEIRVPVMRLDDLGFSGVAFVKIDTEGHEWHVLRGAEATIRRDRPVLLVEIDRELCGDDGSAGTFEWLRGLGYHAYFLRGGRFRGIREFDAARDQAPDVGERLVSNFVFVHEDDARLPALKAEAAGAPA